MRTRRAGAGLTAAMAGLAMMAFAPDASAQPSSVAAVDGRDISVTQTPLAPITTCTTMAQALSYTTFSDTSVFRLSIRASSPLCQPITATAVIYDMPKDGSVWPQTLSETKSFTISEAGITNVTFTKDCSPAQFDVVTGATPATISPLGEHHGPLLFPDVGTAYQDPGIACSPTTTAPPTTQPSGATTVPETSTTVANTSVTSTTTTAVLVGGISTTPTTAGTRVLDTTSSNDPTGTVPQSLAVTGVSSQRLGTYGMCLLAAGLALMLTSRRRTVPAMRVVTSSWSVDPNSPFGLD